MHLSFSFLPSTLPSLPSPSIPFPSHPFPLNSQLNVIPELYLPSLTPSSSISPFIYRFFLLSLPSLSPFPSLTLLPLISPFLNTQPPFPYPFFPLSLPSLPLSFLPLIPPFTVSPAFPYPSSPNLSFHKHPVSPHCLSSLSPLTVSPHPTETTQRAQFLAERQDEFHHSERLNTLLRHPDIEQLLPTHHLADFHYHDNLYAGIRIRSPIRAMSKYE